MTNKEYERRRAARKRKYSLNAVRPTRADGYVNMLNRYGTEQDNSTAYEFVQEPDVPDLTLSMLYQYNGLFAKIIDMPADDMLKKGFDLGLEETEYDDYVKTALDALEWDEKAALAVKWARLFGGSIIVMLVDDGRDLEEPLDFDNIKSIDELCVFERAVITPDLQKVYMHDRGRGLGNRYAKTGQPEYYYVNARTTNFVVHESRCLVFRNGKLPQIANDSHYFTWGFPEYMRIKNAMRDVQIAHEDAPKLLERSVQAIYKMKNLAQLLATDPGEDVVLRRLQIIDMARGLLNSIAIDNDGEDYDFKSFSFTGVSEIIDETCNMLSALTNIPQTLLFGKSPNGMNATGESDLENYYGYIRRMQNSMLKKNLRTLLDILFTAGVRSNDIEKSPDYSIEFESMWELDEASRANVDKIKADTDLVKAQTASVYVDLQALDPTEIRKGLAQSDDYIIEDLINEEDLEGDTIVERVKELLKEQNPQPQQAMMPQEPSQTAEADSSDSRIKSYRPTPQKPTAGDSASHFSDSPRFDGGAGSGNFGHSGRPGSIGGSAPNDGSQAKASKAKFGGYNHKTFASKLKTAVEARRELEKKNPDFEPIAWRVEVPELQDYEQNHPNANMHITELGSTAAVDNGDIISVCKHPDDTVKGFQLLKMAVDAGGNRLDSYEGNHKFYADQGFEAVSWCRWDPDYAPPMWKEAKENGENVHEEDVIFYKYVGVGNVKNTNRLDFKNSTPPADNYDAALKIRDESMGLKTDGRDTKLGVGIIVMKDGRFLVGKRDDDETYCGPGGHIMEGETTEQAAIREAQEEFGITPTKLISIGTINGGPISETNPEEFLCLEFDGLPEADDDEMHRAVFVDLQTILDMNSKDKLYPPFKKSLVNLFESIPLRKSDKNGTINNMDDNNKDGGPGSGNFGHQGRPGKIGGSTSTGQGETSTKGSNGKDSLKRHTGADGKLTKERDKLHRTILGKHFRGVKKPEGQPVYTFLGGGPAAGKSTFVESDFGKGILPGKGAAVMLNPDNIKDELPEYRQMIAAKDDRAAWYAHEESSALTKRISAKAENDGYNVMLDGTGDGSVESMRKKIRQAEAAGMRTEGYYCTCPTEQALRQAEARGARSGRFVDPSIVRQTHKNVSNIWPQIASEFDHTRLYDTSVYNQPRLVAYCNKGENITVVDQKLYQAFLDKANE